MYLASAAAAQAAGTAPRAPQLAQQDAVLPHRPVQRTAPQDATEQDTQLDMQTEQDILQARIDTAENLPLGPGEWQHDDAGSIFA